jgi:hypothetical protein
MNGFYLWEVVTGIQQASAGNTVRFVITLTAWQ